MHDLLHAVALRTPCLPQQAVNRLFTDREDREAAVGRVSVLHNDWHIQLSDFLPELASLEVRRDLILSQLRLVTGCDALLL